MPPNSLTLTIPVRTVSEANTGGRLRDKMRRKRMVRDATLAAVVHALGGNSTDHYIVAARMKARGKPVAGAFATEEQAYEHRVSRYLPAIVTLTRIAPRALDEFDNLPRALKHCVDAIAAALLVDDRDPRIKFMAAQRRGKPKEYAVEVRIERKEMGG